jgi:hypothetical protein
MNPDANPAERMSRALLWGLFFYGIAFLLTQMQTAVSL